MPLPRCNATTLFPSKLHLESQLNNFFFFFFHFSVGDLENQDISNGRASCLKLGEDIICQLELETAAAAAAELLAGSSRSVWN